MNHLSTYVKANTPDIIEDIQPLPLIHATSMYALRNIMADGMVIKPRHDFIFKEALTYFYYGKPVFSRKSDEYSSFLFEAPVYFVFNHGIMNHAKRVFPFDSGALFAGLYSRYIGDRMAISDFNLNFDDISEASSMPTTPMRFIKAIYAGNKNYYLNKPIKDVRYDVLNYELSVYLNLIGSKENAFFDERSSSIEIQSSETFEINERTCICIIAPAEMTESEPFARFMQHNPGIRMKTYNTFRSEPSYYSALAVSIVGDLLNELGLI